MCTKKSHSSRSSLSSVLLLLFVAVFYRPWILALIETRYSHEGLIELFLWLV